MPQTAQRSTESILEAARKLGSIHFPKSRELQADVVSKAWEFSRTANERATPQTLAAFAVRHVRMGRQFRQSVRSLDAQRQGGPRFNRVEMDVRQLPDDDALPAESAILRVDVAEFRRTLTRRQLAILDRMLMGETTRDMAEQLGLTPGRIAQMRREFHGRLREFLS